MTTPKTRARNPRGEGQRLRGDIVRAAAALLEEGEREAPIGLRDVARRVGVSAPSIYAHFADRDAVLLAVVQETCAELKTHLQTASGGPGVGAVARLHARGQLAAARAHGSRRRAGGCASGPTVQASPSSPVELGGTVGAAVPRFGA